MEEDHFEGVLFDKALHGGGEPGQTDQANQTDQTDQTDQRHQTDQTEQTDQTMLKEEWTNMAGPAEERYVVTREKKWMEVDVMDNGKGEIKITIRGLFERINPMIYWTTIEEHNKICIYEHNEQLKMNCPLILKLFTGDYKYKVTNSGFKRCQNGVVENVAEIPAISASDKEVEYQYELLYTEQY